MLITKLNRDGNLEWMKKIPKRQSGWVNKGSMSYKYFQDEKNHFFVILDNPKNENLTLDQVPLGTGNLGSGQLIAYKLSNETGVLEKIILLNTLSVMGMEVFKLNPARIMQSGENEFIVEVYKKKKEDVLIKLKL